MVRRGPSAAGASLHCELPLELGLEPVGLFGAGDSYSGKYANGSREGEGTFIWHTGGEGALAKYVGQFKNNEMHGKGTLSYPDSSQHFDAEWANGQRVGQSGEFKFHDGHTYQGGWSRSTFNDVGCFTYAEGDKYEGQWRQGARHGGGEYTHSNRDVYSGAWHNDKREGVGKFTFHGGGRYEGSWKQDEPMQSGPTHWIGTPATRPPAQRTRSSSRPPRDWASLLLANRATGFAVDGSSEVTHER